MDGRMDKHYVYRMITFNRFCNVLKEIQIKTNKPENHWSCIAHLIAEDMLKSAVIEEKKFKNIEC